MYHNGIILKTILSLVFSVQILSSASGATISIPDSSGKPTSSVEIPVNIDDAAGIAGFQFTITFDQNVLEATGAIDGSLTSGWSIVANTNTPGEITISGLDHSLTGFVGVSGSLCIVQFNVKENTGTNRGSLDFTECKLRNSLAQQIPSTSQSGKFKISSIASIQKCNVKAGKTKKGEPVRGVQGFLAQDSITFTGVMEDIRTDDLAGTIQVTIHSANIKQWYEETINIDPNKVKKGKYTYKAKVAKGAAGRITSFKIDTNKGKFSLTAKNIDLTGLDCPLTLEVMIGGYLCEGHMGETIVNGLKKPIPIQLMSGYDDALHVDKIKAKTNTRKPSMDSLSVKGGFSLKDEPSPITSMTLFLGDQSFNLTDDNGTFTYKRNKKTSEITSVSYTTVKHAKPQIKAKFDPVKCKFTINIKKAELEQTAGQTIFGVFIDMSLSDSDYNETVEVDLD